MQSNSSVPNVNSCNTGHNERFPMFVRETGVEQDHYIVHPDLEHWGQLMTSDTPYTYHPCKVNCLQSRTFDGLQPHQCNFNSLESMRQGYYCQNNWRVQKGHPTSNYNTNQLIWCTVGFTNIYWKNTGCGIDIFQLFARYTGET